MQRFRLVGRLIRTNHKSFQLLVDLAYEQRIPIPGSTMFCSSKQQSGVVNEALCMIWQCCWRSCSSPISCPRLGARYSLSQTTPHDTIQRPWTLAACHILVLLFNFSRCRNHRLQLRLGCICASMLVDSLADLILGLTYQMLDYSQCPFVPRFELQSW